MNHWRHPAVRLGLIVAAVLGLVGGLLWVVPHAWNQDTSPAGRGVAGEDRREAALPSEFVRALPADHLQRMGLGLYALQVQMALTSTTMGVSQDRQATVSAQIALGPDPARAERGWMRGELRAVKSTGDTSLRRELGLDQVGSGAHALAFQTNPQGDVVEVLHDAALPAGVRNVLRATLVGAQVVRAEGGPKGARHWSSIERGMDSEVDTDYERAGGGRIRKQWRRGPTAAGGPTGQGEAEIDIDAAGLRSLRYSYELAVDLALYAMASQRQAVVATLTLSRVATDPGPWQSQTPPGALRTDAQIARAAQTKTRRLPTTRTVAEILAALAQAHTQRDWRHHKDLAAELQTRVADSPADIPELLTALRQPGVDGDPLRSLAEALAFADSPQTQLALAQAMQAPEVPYLAQHALVSAATFVAHPSPDVLAALRTIASTPGHDLQTSAALALAAQARLQLDWDPPLAAALQAEILERATVWLQGPGALPPDQVQSQTVHDERDLWLQALGNMGGDACWPLLEPFVVAQSEWFRRHALESLRFVQLPAVRLALARAMQLDLSAQNRRMATEVALYHPRAAMQEPVLRALKEDPSATVRLGAAQALAVWGLQSPGLYAALQEAAEREDVPAVKRVLLGLHPQDVSADANAGSHP